MQLPALATSLLYAHLKAGAGQKAMLQLRKRVLVRACGPSPVRPHVRALLVLLVLLVLVRVLGSISNLCVAALQIQA